MFCMSSIFVIYVYALAACSTIYSTIFYFMLIFTFIQFSVVFTKHDIITRRICAHVLEAMCSCQHMWITYQRTTTQKIIVVINCYLPGIETSLGSHSTNDFRFLVRIVSSLSTIRRNVFGLDVNVLRELDY